MLWFDEKSISSILTNYEFHYFTQWIQILKLLNFTSTDSSNFQLDISKKYAPFDFDEPQQSISAFPFDQVCLNSHLRIHSRSSKVQPGMSQLTKSIWIQRRNCIFVSHYYLEYLLHMHTYPLSTLTKVGFFSELELRKEIKLFPTNIWILKLIFCLKVTPKIITLVEISLKIHFSMSIQKKLARICMGTTRGINSLPYYLQMTYLRSE